MMRRGKCINYSCPKNIRDICMKWNKESNADIQFFFEDLTVKIIEAKDCEHFEFDSEANREINKRKQ